MWMQKQAGCMDAHTNMDIWVQKQAKMYGCTDKHGYVDAKTNQDVWMH